MPENTAAWLTKAQAPALEVKSAPYTPPKANEIVVKNAAIAINPIDWILQESGTALHFQWRKYPCILGSDTAGEVVEVGPQVTRFKPGDRVVGHAAGYDARRNNPAEGAFQKYTVILDYMTAHIPASLSYEDACVIPLGLSTASCCLFQDETLGLQYPSLDAKPTGKTVLIWGGSSSVGGSAIQLAVAAGYEVITTASPKNFDFVKKLGASQAFDYRTKTVNQDIIAALKGKSVVGAISIGVGAADACRDILAKCEGNKFIAMCTYPTPEHPPESFPILKTMFAFMSWNITHWIKSKLAGVQSKFVEGTDLIHNAVGKAVYVDYLEKALEDGSFVCAPEPMVAGKGVEQIQAALEIHMKGVSAKKVVVTL